MARASRVWQARTRCQQGITSHSYAIHRPLPTWLRSSRLTRVAAPSHSLNPTPCPFSLCAPPCPCRPPLAVRAGPTCPLCPLPPSAVETIGESSQACDHSCLHVCACAPTAPADDACRAARPVPHMPRGPPRPCGHALAGLPPRCLASASNKQTPVRCDPFYLTLLPPLPAHPPPAPGDCYLVAGGLMVHDADGCNTVRTSGIDRRHAANVLGFAQAMLRTVRGRAGAAVCDVLLTDRQGVGLRGGRVRPGRARRGCRGLMPPCTDPASVPWQRPHVAAPLTARSPKPLPELPSERHFPRCRLLPARTARAPSPRSSATRGRQPAAALHLIWCKWPRLIHSNACKATAGWHHLHQKHAA